MNDDKFSFLTDNGFLYDKDLDEWYKDLGEIKLIIWEKIGKSDFWVLSYSDQEDYLYEIDKGYKEQIISSLRIMQRDVKIEQLLK